MPSVSHVPRTEAAMRRLPIPLALLLAILVGPTASGLGGGGLCPTLPECVVQCRPMIAEDLTFFCETVCTVDEATNDHMLAVSTGAGYQARFTDPFGCSAACPFGEEVFEYCVGDTITLGAGQWKAPGGGWLPFHGGITKAEFHVVPLVSTLVEPQLEKLPWLKMGNGSLNPSTGFWEMPWNTMAFTDKTGYLLRVDLFDNELGVQDAYTIARSPKSCGFYGYGAFPAGEGGANVLDLVGFGSPCLGSTAFFSVSGVQAAIAVFTLSLDGDQLPLFGGTLWIDPLQHFLVVPAPVGGGQAAMSIEIPVVPAAVGLSVYAQAGSAQGGTPAGIALSNGVRLDVCVCPQ